MRKMYERSKHVKTSLRTGTQIPKRPRGGELCGIHQDMDAYKMWMGS